MARISSRPCCGMSPRRKEPPMAKPGPKPGHNSTLAAWSQAGLREAEMRFQVAALVAQGYTAKEIAAQLGLRPTTVGHWYQRWGIRCLIRDGVVMKWIRRFDKTHGAQSHLRLIALLLATPRASFAAIGARFGMSKQG